MTNNVLMVNPGHYKISKGITEDVLDKLTNNANVRIIQFSSPLSDKEIEFLEKIVFSKRPDIELRVYELYYGDGEWDSCDLSFLERIPSLRKLTVDLFGLDNFDFLEIVSPKMKKIGLSQTKSKKHKIDSLSRFTDLECLYLEGQQKGIQAIADLKKLQDVTLRSISTDNLDFLSGLQHIWSVDIKLGGIKNFDALTTLQKLKYLELWQVRGLSDLSFISHLPTLQNLFLQSLKQVTKIPDLSKNISLRRICLENLKGLIDLTALRYVPNLKEFNYSHAQNKKPEDLIPVLENPTVEYVACGFGSDKKNACFRELTKNYKKHETWIREFQYE